jgi:hypothetical protein
MILYFGARDVRVPWTTAETHSAPKRAFQYGTVSEKRVSEEKEGRGTENTYS